MYYWWHLGKKWKSGKIGVYIETISNVDRKQYSGYLLNPSDAQTYNLPFLDGNIFCWYLSKGERLIPMTAKEIQCRKLELL